jgi:hypothetical protein
MLLAIIISGALGTGLCPAQSNSFFFQNGDRIVFLGDSITQQSLYTTYIEAYTLTRFPTQSFIFRNAGWSGDTAWLRKRFTTDEKVLFSALGTAQQKLVTTAVEYGLARDVVSLKPTAVTVDFELIPVATPAPAR